MNTAVPPVADSDADAPAAPPLISEEFAFTPAKVTLSVGDRHPNVTVIVDVVPSAGTWAALATTVDVNSRSFGGGNSGEPNSESRGDQSHYGDVLAGGNREVPFRRVGTFILITSRFRVPLDVVGLSGEGYTESPPVHQVERRDESVTLQ